MTLNPRSYAALLMLLVLMLAPITQAQVILRAEHQGQAFVVEQLVDGLGVTWGMAWVGPQRLLLSQRDGRVRLLELDSGRLTEIGGAPRVRASGQGGLLDLVVGPETSQSGSGDGSLRWLYFTYSKPQDGVGLTTLARARLQAEQLVDWQDLLVTRSGSSSDRHYGSRIAFDGQGHLFFSIGDRGDRPNGQDLSTHAGSILRLNLDGSVPADNPFQGRRGALPQIWSYGHRNPQGLAYDPQQQRLWAIEHGPRGGDELNLILAGANYGWPLVSYGKEYWAPLQVGEGTHRDGTEQPAKVYTPSIAPSSLLFYQGDAFEQWRGNLFAGALKLQHLNRLVLDPQGKVIEEQRLLTELGERIRALLQGPQGWLYLSTDSGKLLRLRPASS
ncbi:PQQ-dependent sugar dehydrogenase [Motiliproteus coralliicola]|uniref:PQQ-dependent sugar dehydrogenase n=1 Tax=Motiliproteus coralliicola TaxID=2283196 RepID=A0A369WTV2_9GAMM|nr:PQQ-dependent sugar dehydrogenase [Motiliproteus coralliicola]RDE25097.1 PQQ-dependent sugar dehydrogenase [Motiliproteus coralliicola]